MNSPNNEIPFVEENSIDLAASTNSALLWIDAILQLSVKNVLINTPPASPASGDRYVVGNSPTGLWSGQAKKIARWLDNHWDFYPAYIAVNQGDGKLYAFLNGNWTAYETGGGGGGGEVNTASNVGTGVGLYSTKVGVDLRFKSLKAGTNVSLSQTADEVTINSTASGGSGEVNTASNLGAGLGLYASKVGVDLRFKSLIAGAGISLTQTATDITVESSIVPGETNTASNIGTGVGLYDSKVGVNFRFKSILAGSNVTVTQVGDDVVIDSTASGGETNTASNIGTGIGLFSSKVGVDLRFKSLKAGANTAITETADEITIAATGGSGGGGTVTSVAMTVPTGLTVSGSPIISNGTLALSFATGYSIPTTAKQGQWDSAYSWGNHATAGYVVSTPSLAALAAVTGAADRLPYFTSSSAMGTVPFFAFGRTLVGAANAAAALTTLGIADIPQRVQDLEDSPGATPWLAAPWTGTADYNSVPEGLWLISSAMANSPANIGADALVRVERADGNRLVQSLYSLTNNVSFWRMRIFFGGNYIWAGWQAGVVKDDWTTQSSFLGGFTALAGFPNRIRLFGGALHIQFSLDASTATKSAGTNIWSIPPLYQPPYQLAITAQADLSASAGSYASTINVVISGNTLRLGSALNGTAQKLLITAIIPLEAV